MAEVTLAAIANGKRDEVESALADGLNKTLVESNDEPKYKSAWDLLQTNVNLNLDLPEETKPFSLHITCFFAQLFSLCQSVQAL